MFGQFQIKSVDRVHFYNIFLQNYEKQIKCVNCRG